MEKKPREALLFDEMIFLERLIAKNPGRLDAMAPLAEIYTAKGFYEKGLALDKRLVQLCPKDPVVHYNMACSLALTGSKTDALNVLKRAIELGYDNPDHLKRDPDLKSLHEFPEFKALVRRRKKPQTGV